MLLERIPEPVETAARVRLMVSNVPGVDVTTPSSDCALKKYTLSPRNFVKHLPGVMVILCRILSAGHCQVN